MRNQLFATKKLIISWMGIDVVIYGGDEDTKETLMKDFKAFRAALGDGDEYVEVGNIRFVKENEDE